MNKPGLGADRKTDQHEARALCVYLYWFMSYFWDHDLGLIDLQ